MFHTNPVDSVNDQSREDDAESSKSQESISNLDQQMFITTGQVEVSNEEVPSASFLNRNEKKSIPIEEWNRQVGQHIYFDGNHVHLQCDYQDFVPQISQFFSNLLKKTTKKKAIKKVKVL